MRACLSESVGFPAARFPASSILIGELLQFGVDSTQSAQRERIDVIKRLLRSC